ncbi:GspE/PulE family protein [Aneurinibacillus uraniidurans]|uniref:GspE/PulE family protein n=1 Tax=Aneurinibacillus uraniidurans TaxID=2966586 RepID=UPI00234BD312|nr:GspE/PulE family protein [Aneurinibacillus sp. B1]WCN38873.1 GspE/PulE family protein [Aneurinibacillus sp. B1]
MLDVSEYVIAVIRDGIARGASDIHIEPATNELVIRFRLDGYLQEVERKEEAWGPPVISRLKLMGGMDIGERRLPQDGGFSLESKEEEHGEMIDVRVATLPTIYGEKAVLRLLPHAPRYGTLTSLGMNETDASRVRSMLSGTQGMILVAGATGSGKTTTMYTMLQELSSEGRNIVSLEQPVEYRIPGINQVQIHPRSGLSFHEGLRAVLRQDPDVILVGEIRDKLTAEIAVRAALTGHLLISTIHTKDAVGTIVRLLDMGIEPYLLTSALVGVIAQRLVRRPCPNCYGEMPACSSCHGSGLCGRIGIYEVLVVADDFHPYILHRCSADEMNRYLRTNGFVPLSVSLEQKIAEREAEPDAPMLYKSYASTNQVV